MTELGRNLFYFFIGEIISLAIALLLKEDKRRMLVVFLIGTFFSGVIGFGLPPFVLPNVDATFEEKTNFVSTPSDYPQEPKDNFATEYPPQAPHVTIVGGSGVAAYFDVAKTLGELAEENYSIEERNQINQVLTFTVNLNNSDPVIWRYYWCAKNRDILDNNLQSITVEFLLNSENISDRFSSRYFPFIESPMKGWACFTYESVLKDWDVGVYRLEQNTTFNQIINDGQDSYPAGYKIYDYTVNVR
jgi:hypothetical protein